LATPPKHPFESVSGQSQNAKHNIFHLGPYCKQIKSKKHHRRFPDTRTVVSVAKFWYYSRLKSGSAERAVACGSKFNTGFLKDKAMKKLLLLLWSAILILNVGCAVETGRQQPLIGITSAYKPGLEEESVASGALRYTYINAVLESGGVPVLLPPNQSEEALLRYVKALDGLMLSGGNDIPPSVYGEKPHPNRDTTLKAD